jgi:unsaturated rhamnogalacturonyl hydrolase
MKRQPVHRFLKYCLLTGMILAFQGIMHAAPGADASGGPAGAGKPLSPSAPGGKRVLLDCYYNNEWRTTAEGRYERYHYVWDDTTNSGFSQLGGIVRGLGAALDTLNGAPTIASLKRASIYLIVDPDTPKESPDPHTIDADAVAVIVRWVRDGGRLILLGNDRGNAEFEHLNLLAGRFGIRFNEDSRNRVTGKEYGTGTFEKLPNTAMFSGVKRIFMKEVSTLHLQAPGRALLTEGNDVIIAVAKLGKGMVVAAGDPWFYNEYMDARRLPAGYDNPRTAKNLFRWLLSGAAQGGR